MGAEERPVLIVGSGAVGSVVAARLATAGVPVAVVGRGEHLEAIQRRGLRLEVAGADEPPVRLQAFASLDAALESVGLPESVILTMKAFDVASAAEEVGRRLTGMIHTTGDHPPVVCLQNGVGSEAVAARYLPAGAIWSGVITLSVARLAPGYLQLRTSHGGLTLAPYDHGLHAFSPGGLGDARPGCLPTRLERAGLRVWRRARGDSVKWSKLLLNLWANATCAVFDLLPQDVAQDPTLFHIDWLAFREALVVMRRSRIPVCNLPGYPVRLLASLGRLIPEAAFRAAVGPLLVGGRGGKPPSLLLDVRAGRSRTEVGFLNGAVVRGGSMSGAETPVNAALEKAVSTLTVAGGASDREAIREHLKGSLGRNRVAGD